MEDHVMYRSSPIMIKTIPKGTLLFRLVENSEVDLRGYPKKDGTRCILSNHNVFFYPNPFVGKLALSHWVSSKDYKTITVYILKNDVKVFWLLTPSKYARVDKNRKRFFMKRCSTIRKGCVDKPNKFGSHAPYNPCLSDTIIEKYPDVVGIMGIAVGDMTRIQSAMRNKTVRNKRFYHLAEDSKGYKSIPELILHPLKRRPLKDQIVHPEDKLDTNYKQLVKFDLSTQEKIVSFMNSHAEYDPETYFFKYKA